ncbi:importin-4 isoform X1 [Paramormyrops kingsleyae]|uniref:importin-4 isoform X1 n=1 Tax=Paramormyrops kingsleyae TaxID=1676925 RepID=UPI003B97BF58
MTEKLEAILSRLAEPDSSAVQQATAQLKVAFRDPSVIPALCVLMTNSQNEQIRQSAAVMLRLRVTKHWRKISTEHRERLKAEVLRAFQKETEHAVRHSLSQLSAVLVKRESPDRWPALLALLDESTKSISPEDRRVGLLLLSKVVESNPEPFRPHYCQLLELFGTVLEDLGNPSALYYCILTLTAMTAYTGTEEMALMRSLIPKLIVAIGRLIQADQDQASEAMEVFDELMESEVSIIVPYISEVVQFCLEVSADPGLSDSLRVKALSCIAFLVRLKSKAVLKQKLVGPILQMLFPLLSAVPPPGQEDPEDQEQAVDDDGDSESPKHFAAQVLDTLALHLPPEKLLPLLMPPVETCLASRNPYERKAGLMCLAVLAEGCADHIRTKMLESVLQTVCSCLSDSSVVVRGAALFALGQFSEHLQPEISKYSSDLMPLLLGYLSALDHTKTGHINKAFYALENFLENLGKDIHPYLPTLMDIMLAALSESQNLKIQELAVSAVGAIANAAKELLAPYFVPVISSLKGFLTDTREEMRSLQTQALDTLSVLARTVGKDVFAPLAAECVQLGLNLTDAVDDPDLRRCTYSLFSAVSTVSPDCLTPHLPAITTIMLMALKSTEGVRTHLEEDKQFILLDDDEEEEEGDTSLEDDEGHEEEGTDVAGFSVENAYIDEKADACEALGEMAFSTGAAFLPFLESSFQQVYELRDFPHEDVRRSAFGAMGQFCRAQHTVWQGDPTEDHQQALQRLLSVVLCCLLEAVRQDRERHVVMAALEAMNAILQSCQGEALQGPDRLTDICRTIRDVLKKKITCQDGGGDDDNDDDDEDDQQAEYDAMLLEFAGEGIPLLAAAAPVDAFAPHLREMLPLIINKAKASCTVADRSFSVGTLAEILQALGRVPGGSEVAGQLATQVLPVLVGGARDDDAEVRSNSVFGLGALAEAAGPAVLQDYPMMLALFSSLLSKEVDARVIDNLCAAICRLIMSSAEAVPLEQVFPALVSRLPLKEDLEENQTVFSCLAFLYGQQPSLVLGHLTAIVSASSHVLRSKDVDTETLNTLLVFLRNVVGRNPTEFEGALMSLPPEQREGLTAAVTQS